MQELEEFRREVRQWLEANCPESQRQPITVAEQFWGGRRGTFPSEDARLWYQRMRDKGWIAPEWPGSSLISSPVAGLQSLAAPLWEPVPSRPREENATDLTSERWLSRLIAD